MTKKKHKVPNNALRNEKTIRKPIVKEQFGDDSGSPTWIFSKFDVYSKRWGMGIFEENFNFIFDKLKSFESMSWHTIKKQTHDKGVSSHHGIKIESLSKDAKDRLEEIKMDDLVEVFSLRITNTFRIIGIKDGRCFGFLWIDPNHEVCPSLKKHT